MASHDAKSLQIAPVLQTSSAGLFVSDYALRGIVEESMTEFNGLVLVVDLLEAANLAGVITEDELDELLAAKLPDASLAVQNARQTRHLAQESISKLQELLRSVIDRGRYCAALGHSQRGRAGGVPEVLFKFASPTRDFYNGGSLE